MNVFNFTSKHVASRIVATLAFLALLTSFVPLQQASAQAAPTCTVEIVSNTDVLVEQTGNDAVAVPLPLHPAWTAVIPGATWIWGDNQTATTSGAVTYTFQNQFGFVGNVTNATLYVASDNDHNASLNSGTDYAGGSSFNSVQTYNLATSSILQGDNELLVSVTNAGPQGDLAGNPAGALYRLVIEGQVTTDSDCSINYGDEVPVLGCTDDAASNYEPLATPDNADAEDCTYDPLPVCEIGDNLLDNPSFELPVIGGQWALTSITDWIVTNDADALVQGEIWKGLITPSEGLQNLELDAAERTTVTQTVETTVGATYEFRFDFAARSSNAADNNVNALVDGNVLINANSGNTSWTTYSQTFVATGTTTEVALRDVAEVLNTEGSLVDNAVLCFVSDPEVVEEETYTIYGYVWHDDNDNDEWDGRFLEEINPEEEPIEAEVPLGGRVITITNEEEVSTTTVSEESGYYQFVVPAGTWTITENLPEGWEHTATTSYVVIVPEPIPAPDNLEVFLDNVREFFIPTAHAQRAGFGEFNFGNNEITVPSGGGGGSNNGGGGSLMTPASRTPVVRGDSTNNNDVPEPQVLGEQVSVVPVGAPDAGGGGTSPLSIQLPTLVAAFLGRRRFDV